MTSPNKKSFDLSLLRTKAFDIVIYGIAIVDTILFNISMTMPITFIMKLTGKLSTSITSTMDLVFSEMKLTVSPDQALDAKTIIVSYVLQLTGKISTAIGMGNAITFISSAIQKLSAALDAKIFVFDFDPIIATFLPLSDHDGKDLSVMDVEDLVDLDYTT